MSAAELSDGRRIVIRPIRPSDREHLVRGLQRLSKRTSRLRFHQDRDHFTESELTYLTTGDSVDRIVSVAIGLDKFGNEEIGVGVARAYRDKGDRHLAEVSIVVVDDWQRHGVGRLMLAELGDRCRQVGIQRWLAYVLGDNDAVVKVLTSVGTIIGRSWSDGVQAIELEIGPQKP